MRVLFVLAMLCGCGEERTVHITAANGLDVYVNTSTSRQNSSTADVTVSIGPKPVYTVMQVPVLIPYESTRCRTPMLERQ